MENENYKIELHLEVFERTDTEDMEAHAGSFFGGGPSQDFRAPSRQNSAQDFSTASEETKEILRNQIYLKS